MRRATIEVVPERLGAYCAAIARLAARHGPEALERVHGLLDTALGVRDSGYRIPGYQPVTLVMPGLHPRPFHDPSSGPLAEVERAFDSAYPAIRAEAENLLEEPAFFASFVDHAYDRDKFQMSPKHWREAFLVGGPRRHENAAVRERCPATVSVLESLRPHITGDASFSVLEPGALIPAHHGEINFRLTGHLPLIVPGDCGLEAGGERHQAREGEFFVFDDGFIHHAWNRSSRPPVHLLFML